MKMFKREYSKFIYKNKSGEVWLKRPSQSEWHIIKTMIATSTKLDNQGRYVVSEEDSVKYIKYIYDNLTSQGEETASMSLSELSECLNKVIFELKIREAVTLYRKIEELLKDIVAEIKYDLINEIYEVESYAGAIDISQQTIKAETDLQEVLNKHGIELSIDEARKIQEKKDKLEKEKEELNKTTENE